MKYLIDTNIAIHARDGFEPVLDRLADHDGVVFLSALSLPVLPFDAAAAETYGQIMAQIGWTRRQDFDRLIGAHALASGCTLVTANTADFSDIPGLIIEDWTLAA